MSTTVYRYTLHDRNVSTEQVAEIQEGQMEEQAQLVGRTLTDVTHVFTGSLSEAREDQDIAPLLADAFAMGHSDDLRVVVTRAQAVGQVVNA